ncbi:MAG: hypothetical protein AAB466_10745 [Verrucomicrobiota bacterium]
MDGGRLRFVFFGERRRSADDGIGTVNRLEDVEVKLFSTRQANVETVSLDGFVDALRVNRQHFVRALKRRIVQCRTGDSTVGFVRVLTEKKSVVRDWKLTGVRHGRVLNL